MKSKTEIFQYLEQNPNILPGGGMLAAAIVVDSRLTYIQMWDGFQVQGFTPGSAIQDGMIEWKPCPVPPSVEGNFFVFTHPQSSPENVVKGNWEIITDTEWKSIETHETVISLDGHRFLMFLQRQADEKTRLVMRHPIFAGGHPTGVPVQWLQWNIRKEFQLPVDAYGRIVFRLDRWKETLKAFGI